MKVSDGRPGVDGCGGGYYGAHTDENYWNRRNFAVYGVEPRRKWNDDLGVWELLPPALPLNPDGSMDQEKAVTTTEIDPITGEKVEVPVYEMKNGV